MQIGSKLLNGIIEEAAKEVGCEFIRDSYELKVCIDSSNWDLRRKTVLLVKEIYSSNFYVYTEMNEIHDETIIAYNLLYAGFDNKRYMNPTFENLPQLKPWLIRYLSECKRMWYDEIKRRQILIKKNKIQSICKD